MGYVDFGKKGFFFRIKNKRGEGRKRYNGILRRRREKLYKCVLILVSRGWYFVDGSLLMV